MMHPKKTSPSRSPEKITRQVTDLSHLVRHVCVVIFIVPTYT
jgi:hypothetical protein